MKKGATGSIFGSGSDPDSNGSVDPEPGNADRGRPKLSKKGENEEKKLKFMSWSLDLAQCLDPELDSVNPD
jgi:hypothetical protein